MERISQINFGEVSGKTIVETTMRNGNGMTVSSCTYGATITKLLVPDRHGEFENIVCSFPSVEGYRNNPQFFGATIGPFAGRLENAEIQMGDIDYKVQPNEGAHLLHGGDQGFHQVIWNVSTTQTSDASSTQYKCIFNSDYPGEITMTVTMTLNDANELSISYVGTSTEDTLLNCTNHTYFNLSGNLKRTVHEHRLTLPAPFYIPITKQGLPLGQYEAVLGTLFDFKEGKLLRNVIGAKNGQIDYASGGLDHPFIVNGQPIVLYDAESGRKMVILSEDQAVVVYTGNKIGSNFEFTEAPAQNFLGVCLEEQNVPNSSLYSHFPSSFLSKNKQYNKKTIYRFTWNH